MKFRFHLFLKPSLSRSAWSNHAFRALVHALKDMAINDHQSSTVLACLFYGCLELLFKFLLTYCSSNLSWNALKSKTWLCSINPCTWDISEPPKFMTFLVAHDLPHKMQEGTHSKAVFYVQYFKIANLNPLNYALEANKIKYLLSYVTRILVGTAESRMIHSRLLWETENTKGQWP